MTSLKIRGDYCHFETMFVFFEPYKTWKNMEEVDVMKPP